jgi:hypothetical protein
VRARVAAADAPARAPFLSWRGVALALGIAVLLCWPMLVTGFIYVFPDTAAYLRGGEVAWTFVADMLRDALAPAPEGPAPATAGAAIEAAAGDNGRGPVVVRSIAYSVLSYSLWATGGAFLVALAQGAIAVFATFAFLGPANAYRMPVLLAGALVVIFASSLPWFSIYLMPDIFAALVLLHAALLVRRFDDLTTVQQAVMTAIAAFATAAHYGHPPLALGLFAAAIAWRLVTRRWSTAALIGAAVPILLTPLANLTISAATLDRPSAAPLRLPILLARSLADGPARWYLEEACPDADFAICVLFAGDAPDSIRDFLWSDEGIESLPRATVARIQDEEFRILFLAFRAYPVQQTTSLLGNATAQIFLLGLGDLRPATGLDDRFQMLAPDGHDGADATRSVADVAVVATTWGSLALLAIAAALGRLRREEIEIVAMVVLGLLLNALVFGGLSAPAERYQARVAWIVPVLAVIFLGRRRIPAADRD